MILLAHDQHWIVSLKPRLPIDPQNLWKFDAYLERLRNYQKDQNYFDIHMLIINPK